MNQQSLYRDNPPVMSHFMVVSLGVSPKFHPWALLRSKMGWPSRAHACYSLLRASFSLENNSRRYIGIIEQASEKNGSKIDAKMCIL